MAKRNPPPTLIQSATLLDECLFCGSDDVELAIKDALYFVQCQSCLARGPAFTTSVQAERLWNDDP